jgi:hypothetical protein
MTNGQLAVKEAFVREQGQIGDPFDEDTWLLYFGLFVSGWEAALKTMRAAAPLPLQTCPEAANED